MPVRKSGKLPGECEKVTYAKEYGSVRLLLALVDARHSYDGVGFVRGAERSYQTGTERNRSRRPNRNRSVSPPLPSSSYELTAYMIGGSAMAAGELIAKCGGNVLEYLFIIEVAFLKGSEKLNAPAYCIISD